MCTRQGVDYIMFCFVFESETIRSATAINELTIRSATADDLTPTLEVYKLHKSCLFHEPFGPEILVVSLSLYELSCGEYIVYFVFSSVKYSKCLYSILLQVCMHG